MPRHSGLRRTTFARSRPTTDGFFPAPPRWLRFWSAPSDQCTWKQCPFRTIAPTEFSVPIGAGRNSTLVLQYEVPCPVSRGLTPRLAWQDYEPTFQAGVG